MSQREISLTQLTATRASGAVVLIRLYVGLIFVGEGVLKFLRPETLGPGRFDQGRHSRRRPSSPTWTAYSKSGAAC